MSTHTPGPWKSSFYSSGEQYIIRADNAPHVSGAVCIVLYDNSGGTLRQPAGEEMEMRRAIGAANAALIAAAPELLAALEQIAALDTPGGEESTKHFQAHLFHRAQEIARVVIADKGLI